MRYDEICGGRVKGANYGHLIILFVIILLRPRRRCPLHPLRQCQTTRVLAKVMSTQL